MGFKTAVSCKRCYTPRARTITRRKVCGNRFLAVYCTIPRSLNWQTLQWESQPYDNISVGRINANANNHTCSGLYRHIKFIHTVTPMLPSHEEGDYEKQIAYNLDRMGVTHSLFWCHDICIWQYTKHFILKGLYVEIRSSSLIRTYTVRSLSK